MQRCGQYPDAVAQIHGGIEAPHLTGWVRFYQERRCVLIEASISGLPESETGFFGFHIHQGQRCSGTDFSGTGNHYNSFSRLHPQHAGDLPPLLGCRGNAYLSLRTDRFSADEIIGRTVVIHSNPDDFHSQPAGNAGRKIACGEIRRAR
jgi:Cu-Zn family superoxide dismutase